MNELNNSELLQIVNYYKQKVSDLELQVLQLQLKINKISISQTQSTPAIKNVINKNKK